MVNRAIDNYNDFKNFKVNMKLFNQYYNKNNRNKNLLIGGSSANENLQMSKFLNVLLPKLQGGYRDFKGGADDAKSFNFFRDVLSPESQPTFTNINLLNDINFKNYNYPLEQTLSRTSF